jgi:glycosyltransferase involved in cell wall biosynthesis
MRVSFDISSIVYNRGVSFYTTNLVRHLKQSLGDSDALSVFGMSFGKFAALKNFARELAADARLYPVPPSFASFAFHTAHLPIDMLIQDSDIFHTWEWYLPKSRKVKTVITLHDVALFKFPHLTHPIIEKQHREVMDRIKQLKPTIIAVSQSTKNDLIEVCGLPAESIHVVYEAIPLEHQIKLNQTEVDAIKQKFSLKRPYMLMVGTAEPRKNYTRQIEAWQRYKKDFDLVIVGAMGWENLPRDTGIIRITDATAHELAALYQGSSLLLYCSLYEGFGLPILEAFYHQVPVVTANTSAMAEIGAPAAILCDPNDVQSIKVGIDQAFARADNLRVNGLKRLQDFSWKKAARETMHVYKASES